MFGCLPEQLIDHTIEEFVSGVVDPSGVVGGAPTTVDAAQRGLGNGQQLYGHHPGGAAFPVELSVASIDTADGPVTVATVRDAVGQSERRFRRMAEVITIGLGLKQIDPPDYLYPNPAFYQILGLDPASPRPGFEEVSSLIHPDDLPAAASAAARLESGETVQQELRLTRLDGEPRWIRFTSSPVTDEHGTVNRVATTVENVTAAKTTPHKSAPDSRRRSTDHLVGVRCQVAGRGLVTIGVDRPPFSVPAIGFGFRWGRMVTRGHPDADHGRLPPRAR